MSGAAGEIVELRDPELIGTWLRRDPVRHLYELGDLEEPHWSRSRWFGLTAAGGLQAMALLYQIPGAPALPMLLVMGSHGPAYERLLCGLKPHLPAKVYLHVEESQLDAVRRHLVLETPAPLARMALTEPTKLAAAKTPAGMRLRALTAADVDSLQRFYDDAYPGHWFVPEMLSTGRYHGAFLEGRLVGAAGTHVLSRANGTAALGNIATISKMRRRGVAGAVTAALCRELLVTTPAIGLNVRIDNAVAVACYAKIGFTPALRFYEAVAARGA